MFDYDVTNRALKKKFWKWKDTFETKGLKINISKANVILSGLNAGKAKTKLDLSDIGVVRHV